MSNPRWKIAEVPRPPEVPEEATARMLRVTPELAGTRLDVFLSLSLRSTSRTRAKRIAKHAAFTPEGRKFRPNQRLRAEEHVVLWRVPVDDLDEELELPIVYQDAHILVINKPPDLTVHPTASHYHHTVIKLLENRFPDQYFSLVHRLDRDTSGILIVALSPASDRAFKMLLEGTIALPKNVDTSLTKTYQAITWGVPEEGIIDLPLERDPENTMRVKMRVAAPGAGLSAQTGVRVLDRTPIPVDGTARGYALVECRLFTGRQHQIRLHLAARGTPVVGDRLYGPDERLHARGADRVLTEADLLRLEMPRQALHAWRYELPHAVTWERLSLEAPLPDDMALFWRNKVDGT
jgi:23S rRNA pseudouridine1911/1915/1917 synthase